MEIEVAEPPWVEDVAVALPSCPFALVVASAFEEAVPPLALEAALAAPPLPVAVEFAVPPLMAFELALPVLAAVDV